jgi:hypothetical protein
MLPSGLAQRFSLAPPLLARDAVETRLCAASDPCPCAFRRGSVDVFF